MSRVLARKLFKKKAPKRSAKGVGITSMLEDDVAGYAEGGEVDNNDRAKRERMAQELLDLGRAEFQMFAEGERPQMTRPPATMGMVPQPNPQAAQAAQMQQMAQMGMLPRFQEGGMVETPSIWSRVKDFMWNPPGMDRPPTLAEMRRDMGRSIGIPSLTGTGVSGARTMADPNAMTPAMASEQVVTPMYRNPVTAQVSEEPQPRQFPPEGTMTRPDSIGGQRPVMIPTRDESRILRAQEQTPVSEDESGREARRAEGFRKIAPKEAAPVEKKVEKPTSPMPPKPSDLTDIKAEREAKAAMARQENAWLALMQAGLAIAGGRSPNAITNIGQGGQAGLASFMALEQQRRRDEDAAMRRDIAEKEYRLQERRFQAQEPLLAAQAEYWKNRPAVDAARLQAQQQVARQRAVDAAQKAWENRTKSGPFALEYLKMNEVQKKAAEELYLRQEFNRRYNEELSAFRAGVYGGGQRETGPSAEE